MDIDATIGNDATLKGGALAGLGRIDQYELVRELGGGGFGCVFLAKDTVAGIEVAVKGLPPEVRHNKEELENIRANFALVSRLHHPNIAAALVLHPAVKAEYSSRDVMEKLRVFERDTMMVMEYAPGVTLSQWRKQFPEKKVPLEKALDITRQVAAALDYAHGEKIVHRDVKPSNVMIETKADGSIVARVLDFGLAAEIRSSMGRVSREIRDTSGTRPYMAPEQWRGAKQGPATDQYALAAMFCELVTGEVPFASVFDTGDPVVMKNTVLNDVPEFPKGLPRTIRVALLKSLAKQGEERYSDCRAFAAALSGTRFAASAGRAWLVVTVLIVLALVAVGGWWWRERVKGEELRMKNEALAAERARKDAEESRIAEEKRKAEEVRREENARAAAEKAEQLAEENHKKEESRIAAEKAREAEAKAAADKAEAERKAKAESERLAEEKRKADEVKAAAENAEAKRKAKAETERIVAEKRKAEEQRRAEKVAEEKAALERKRLFTRLREGGSEFLPNPPGLAAGSEKRVALANGGWMDFVWCPPGRFLMGSPESEEKRNVDETQHLVTLTRGFWIGKTEVTRAQWKAVMGDAGFAWSSLWGGDAELPIDTVSWHQCREFCKKAGNGFRLPTEAEWEYACRAGSVTPFSFGVSLNGTTANCAGGADPYGTLVSGPNSFGSKQVASYQQNPWGLYDMHGNLFEWCADYYAEYPEGDLTDPKGPETGSGRVIRGGCWNFAPKMCRSAFRNRKDPSAADTHTGFRVCCDRLP